MHPRTYRVAAGIALAVSLCVAVIAGYVSILVVDVIGVLAVPGVSGATVSRKCGKRVAPTFRRTTPCFWCGRRDSNPHEGCPSAVFKTAASAVPPRPPVCDARIPDPGDDHRAQKSPELCPGWPGAEDGIRTRDLLLGKEMLYH